MQIQSVLSMAPLRVSFLGGGSDIQTFYSKHRGLVVSAAISKYVYVHIKRHDPLFQERYRISYSEVENTNSRKDIKNSIVRGCLELLNIDEPIQISTSADLPANSGLGSSSSFAVALLNGLHALRNENSSPVQLAEEASEVEINILGSPIGKQDQYAAAFGGFNSFEFVENGSVRIEPINLPRRKINNLLDNSIMIWTGQSRSTNTVLVDQATKLNDNFDRLIELTILAQEFKTLLVKSESKWSELGPLIKNGWELKQTFSKKIVTNEVKLITDTLDTLGSTGYKLLGAGGGGFILATFEELNPLIISKLKQWQTFVPSLDFHGSRIVSIY